MADREQRRGRGLSGLEPALRLEIESLIEARVEARLESMIGAQIEAQIEVAVSRRLEAEAGAEVASRVAALEQRVLEAQTRLTQVESNGQLDQVSLLVFSGDMDRVISAFIIATGAVAMGCEVSMYFTFWGLLALKKRTVYAEKSIPERMLAMFLPGSASSLGTSRMNMLGMGPALFRSLMRKHNVETLPDLIGLAQELGVRMVACQMAMGVMGIRSEELLDGLEYGGAATYLGDAIDSKVTLFI